MRILFNTSTYVGDAIVTTGLLGHLIERYPEGRLTIACGQRAAPLFTEVPNLERLIPIRKRRWHLHWADIWWPSVLQHWDLVVDLKGSGLSYLLSARRRIAFRPRHARGGRRTLEMATLFGLEALPTPRLWTAARHEAAADRLLGSAPAPVLALGPTGSWAPKIWPAERFADLALRLTGDQGILPRARIVLIGAPGEEDWVGPIKQAMPGDRLIDLVGRTDLLTAHAVLKRCALFIGNDSAPLHLSVTAGIPGLGLIGPSDSLFGPPDPPYVAPWAMQTALVHTAIPLEALTARLEQATRTGENLMASLTVDAAEQAAIALWERCRPGRNPRSVQIAAG